MSKTVKVEMLVSIAGLPEPRYELGDFSFAMGQVVDLNPDLARAWVAGGIAKAVAASAPVPETTALKPAETAVLPEGKPKRSTRETTKTEK